MQAQEKSANRQCSLWSFQCVWKEESNLFLCFCALFFVFHMFVNDIWLETVDINKTTILINHKVLLCQWHHIYTTTNNSFTTTVCSVTVSHSHMTPVQTVLAVGSLFINKPFIATLADHLLVPSRTWILVVSTKWRLLYSVNSNISLDRNRRNVESNNTFYLETWLENSILTRVLEHQFTYHLTFLLCFVFQDEESLFYACCVNFVNH